MHDNPIDVKANRMFKILIRSIVPVLAFGIGCEAVADHSLGATQLIQNALIVDGSGAPGFHGDLRFDRDGIIAVGELEALATDQVINANGMVLSPGFDQTRLLG